MSTTTETIVIDIPVPDAVKDKFAGIVGRANAIALDYQAHNGDLGDKVEAYLENPEDEAIAKRMNWIRENEEKIAALQEKIAATLAECQEAATKAVAEDSDFDNEKAEADFLDLRKQATVIRKGIEQVFGAGALDALGVEEMVSLKAKTTRKGSGSGTNAGSGTSRSSFSEITVNGTPLTKPTFSEAATLISKDHGKVSASDLRNSLSAAHGDVSENHGTVYEFTHTVTAKDGNAVTVNLTATPTENVRRQPKADDAA